MDAKFHLREQLVGLFLVITLILSVGAIIVIGRGKNWFSKHHTYYTKFQEGYGLKEGSTVKMFNAEVGRVRRVTINDDNEVEVTIDVLADYEKKVRQDSVATVESPTLIGSEFIAITPGSKTAAVILPGGYIRSTPRKSISNYMEEFGLEQKFAQVGRVLDTLAKVTSDLAVVMEELKRPGGPLMGALADVKAVTGDIRAGRGSVGKLLADDDLYQKLDRLTAQLEQTATNLNEVTANMKPVGSELPALARELGQSAKDIRAIVANFKRGSEDFPALVTDTDEAVRQFRRVVESAKTLPLLRSGLPPDLRRDQVDLDPRGM
jgi:phospholipid/cholesterol/gamma-HCH transport system substrate-binding protein